jgi:DNA-binding transcriptional MerR regulator
MPVPPLTIGDVARHFGCETWQVRRVITTGRVPEPPRLGAYRVFYPSDLPHIETALRAAGYLPQEVAHA